MHAKRWLKLSLFSLLFVALPLMAMQQPVRPPLEDAPALPNDFMPAAPTADLQPGAVTDASYEVAPILFVPADVTPLPNGLDYVDRQMGNVRHWYAEILNGRTFTLRPAELIIGQHPRTYYFGDCYPPVSSSTCDWGYQIWNNVFAELDSRGYTLPANVVQGIFFQGESIGTSLGGGRRFLASFQPDGVFPDCIQVGCGYNVSLGGVSHELGHALGLPHPNGDPQYGISVMGTGFYYFPQATFINSAAFPEYDQLLASPFINVDLPLDNPDFEDCLTGWEIANGSPNCVQLDQLSGLNALQLDWSHRTQMSQTFALSAADTYDFSGWVNAATIPGGGEIKIQLKALRANSSVVETYTLAEIDQPTGGWVRVGATVNLPASASEGALWITTKGSGIQAYLDDLSLAPAEATLPAPLIASAFDGDSAATDRPALHWSPVASAATFDVQVATDPFFESLLADASDITGYTYESPALPYGQYSYWRVRAVNGAGAGDWSPAWGVIPREPADFHSDEFEESALNGAWSFVREDPTHWHIGGLPGRRWEGFFVVDMESGDLEQGNNAQNLLLRPAPEDDFSLETITVFWYQLNADYQQGGLIIYQDDDNYIRLGHVFRDGMRTEFEAEINGVVQQRSDEWVMEGIRLRIERRGNTYTAAYSASGVNWTPLGQPVTVDWPDAKIGLAAYAAPPATDFPSAAFNWFRVTDPCAAVTVVIDPVGSGSVSTAGASCGDGRFRPNSPLRLTAAAAPGYVFDHWSGAGNGDVNPLEIDVTGDPAVTAHFRTASATGPDLYLSPATAGTVGGIAVTPQDILKLDGATGAWSLYFDGSDVGVTKPIVAFAHLDDGDLLLAFKAKQVIPGAGTFAPQDVARFSPVAPGDMTEGTFHWYFDGSDVGLQGGREQIDALDALPDGRLLISTTGTAAVPGAGDALMAQDEDLLAFTPTTLGEATDGTWELYLDGTSVPGMKREDVSGAAVDSAGDIYVALAGNFNIGGIKGNDKDILRLHPTGGGYTVARYWHGPDDGFRLNIGGLEIGGD